MEFRPFYLAREWVRAGHQVRIVAASHSHIRANQPQFSGAVKEENIEGVEYQWLSTPAYEGNGIGRVKNIFSFVLSLWRKSREIQAKFKPDVVVASSTYPMDIWPAYRLAKMAGAQLCFEVHDLWPLSPMEVGGMSKWHPFIMLVQAAEDFAYKRAGKVVSMLPKAKEYMISRGMDEAKFVYVPNGIDEAEWRDPEELPSVVEQAMRNIQNRGLPIVGYSGTHGLSNALDTLLDVAGRLKDKIQFVLIGTGPEKEHLLNRVKKEKLDNVEMLPPIPKRSVQEFLRRIDIAYIGWQANPLYRFGISPNKLMDYMVAGCPIVHSVRAGNDPVAEAGCGLTVPPGDVQAIADAIERLAALPKSLREEMGQRGRKFILENQTYRVLANRFAEAVDCRAS